MKKAEKEHRFVLRAAGGPSETSAPGLGSVSGEAVIHHVLKFNPMDTHSIEDFGAEWLFQKEPLPKDPYEEKRKLKMKAKDADDRPEKPTQDWKRPWLIGKSDDKDLSKAFLAKRETDKRTKLDVLVRITLTKVEVYCKPDANARLKEKVKTDTNKQLERIYNDCKTTCIGPGTDVLSMHSSIKSRSIDESKKFEVQEFFVRMSRNHLNMLEGYKVQEQNAIGELWQDKTLNLAEEMKPGSKNGVVVDINGRIVSWKIEEEGKKQHSYFWLEMDSGGRELLVRPVHGDWWAARKDGTRRGWIKNEDDEPETKTTSRKKEQEKEELTSNLFRRLLDKTKEATADEYIENGQLVKKKVKEARRALEETGENMLKQQWREENHGEDDEMDAQQCGDIDDDDYDQKMAAAGDDLALAAEEIIRHIDGEEDAPEETLKSDSEDEGEDAMDQDGKKMDRLLKGKPAPEMEIEDLKDEEKPSPSKDKMEIEDKLPSLGEKSSGLKITIPKQVLPPKRPADTAAPGQNPAKRPKPAVAGVSGGQIWTKCPPPSEFRKYVGQTKDVSLKNLIAKFNVKQYPQEEQNKFKKILSEHCKRTKRVVPDGPYKDEPILTLKPLPAADGSSAGAPAAKPAPKT